MSRVDAPFPLFAGLDNRLLDNGYVYFGLENEDPQTDPIAIFSDEAMTVPLAQPLRTKAGVLCDGDTPVNVFIASAYSVRIRNFVGVQVYYVASVPPSNATTAALVTVKGWTPGVIRSLQQLEDEGLSLTKDFDATGDDSTNNGSKINAAVAAAFGEGLDLNVPPGVYRYDVKVDQTLPAPAIVDNGRHPTIRGQGSGISRLVFTGPNSDDAFRVVGNHPSLDAFAIRNVGIVRPNAPLGSVLTGAGLVLEKLLGATLDDVLVFNHGLGIKTTGSLVMTAKRLVCFFNRQAASFEYGNISGPNVMSFESCVFNQNNTGVVFDQGCSITFTGCTFEGTGNTNTSTTPEDSFALKFTNCGREGQVVLAGMGGTYFESNFGYDVIIEHKEFAGSYDFYGATFQRRTVVNRPIISFRDTDAHLYAANPAEIILNGCQVRRYAADGGVGVPSSTTPVLQLQSPTSFTGLTIRDSELGYTTSGNAAYNWQNTPERTAYGSRTLRYEGNAPAPTFANSWSDVGGDFSFYCYRDLFGFVQLGGTVQNGVTTDGTVMFTLPANVRPVRSYEQFAVVASTGLCYVRVGANGNVLIYGASGASGVSLSGVSFRCE